jgi:hypothetical protein
MYSKADCHPSFAFFNNPDYYFDVDRSLAELIKLLEFQFQNDQEQILAFVTRVYDIIEKRIPKLNTIVITSAPSAGKNFFFDCIIHYFLNFGKLGRANKMNNFAFQDAEARRIIMWNEPDYSQEFVECLKELLGGDTTNVSVKYKAESTIFRTPIIILTNRPLSIINAPAFKDRICTYKWQPFSHLLTLKNKPNPLATYKLFQHYGVI